MKLILPEPGAVTMKNESIVYKFTDTDLQEVKKESNASTCNEQVTITVTVIIKDVKFKFEDSLTLEKNVGILKTFLRQQSASSRNNCKHVVIELSEPNKVTVDAFRVIATDFLKKKEVGLSEDRVGEILAAATHLDIPELREACHHFIALRPDSGLATEGNKCNKPPSKGQRVRKESKYESSLMANRVTPPHTGQRSFECHLCHKTFRKKHTLIIHVRSHTGERPFTCHICHKSFRDGGTLKHHLLKHNVQKGFQCSVCHKAFTWNATLKRHKLTHTGQKPFECSVCHRSFRHSGNLKHHLLTHTGQRPFECSVCHRTFTRNEHLKYHLLIHTGQKSFACPTCFKTFTSKSNVKRHMRSHTKPFQCHTCHKSFSSVQYLKIHPCKTA